MLKLRKMLIKNLSLLFFLVALLSCNSSQKQNNQDKNKDVNTDAFSLQLIWESDTLLRTPESVLVNPAQNILYVSNVNMNPWEKDRNGFISKMDKTGNIIQLKWIEGLNGPKGMGISGSSLFIADIDALVEVNIESGEILNKIEVPNKPDLNDITVAKNGTVYVSGSGSNTIYILEEGELKEIFTGEEGERFNGLFWEKDRMLLATSASSQFKEINWKTNEVNIIAENMGHGDGIAPVGDGGYLVTSWAGAIFYVSPEGKVTKLLDTEALDENSADIYYSIKDQILYVPTFFKNQVKAYKLIH